MEDVTNFEDLEVYRACRDFRKDIAGLVKTYYPDEEKYLLTSRTLDASRMITKYIAEGHGRDLYSQYLEFLNLSRSALMETLEYLIIAHDEAYITPDILITIRKKYHKCLKLLNMYANQVKRMIH